jgi:hypothetical protein
MGILKEEDVPEHVKYWDDLKPEPEDTSDHPFHKFATIDQKWSTPFMEMRTQFPEKVRQDLCRVLESKELNMDDIAKKEPDFADMAKAKGFYATTHYNLFDEKDMDEFPNEKQSILEFEQVACQQIRYYIRYGWGIRQANDMIIEGRCFGNVQQDSSVGGTRTYPHYHQDINGVLVHYLQMGDDDIDLADQIKIGQEQSARNGTHQVLFQDPRPAISYPYWEKVYAICPTVGLTLIHPNYLWHETNPWLGKGTRICIVVNFRIISHGYNELLKTFRG